MVRATPEPRERTPLSFPGIAEPYYVTPHAVERYRQRVDRHATAAEAMRCIQRGIQGVAPCYPVQGRPIALGDRRRRFVAIVAPPREGQEWPSVLTVWGWGICPILLKKKGGPREGWRHYRWLNGPGPEARG